ncbi:FAD-dependent monooxygenase [Lentzea sp. NPDC051213]|uniref:FAD-dependent monooxygenase n=1 Tax=Lentzea sp. NPDC051213 TaxID=3364126 RepID=UPI003794D75D
MGKRALVVGLGISGMATAITLHRHGWQPVIVEKAPDRRKTGYFVLVYGAGRAAAGRLGILEDMPNRAAELADVFSYDRLGNRSRTTSFDDLPNPPYRMLRTDVEEAAFAHLPADVEIRYSTSPTRIDQDPDGVDVEFDDGSTERFDLVVGADGLRSTVRRLAFGPDEDYLHPMSHVIAAFQLEGPLPGLATEDMAMLLEPARALWVFGFEGRKPTVMLTYRTDDVDAEFAEPPVTRLRKAFGPEPTGKMLGEVLDQAQRTPSLLFDQPEQVKMDRWSSGRVVLVGDSAWCVTLYAGMGVSAGLTGGDLLGTMLSKHPGDIRRALTEWEHQLRPAIGHYQQRGHAMRLWFNPHDRREMLVRKLFVDGGRLPVLGPVLNRQRARNLAEFDRDVAA